ncbi:MAG: fumarylacetoacetate hydrolase family protein [Pseudomonadota bacterium]
MRFVRFGEPNRELPGVVDGDGVVRDISALVDDIDLAVHGDALNGFTDAAVAECPKVDSPGRFGPCVANIGKFICVGLNYTDHAEEAGMAPPSEPILFMKATSAVSGPDDPIILPPNSVQTDWEVELAIIIGKTARYIQESEARDHVFGYCLSNDVSERGYQIERGGQWVKGKSADSFGPIGPWLVRKDAVNDPQALRLQLSVNGEKMQDASTANMIFATDFLVSYISQFMTLHPGDVISTGTPAGVGMGQKPQVYLKAGDVVTLEGEGLGRQEQRCVNYGS